MISLRECGENEHDLLARLWNEEHPLDRFTAESIRRDDNLRTPGLLWQRWIAEDKGEPLAWAVISDPWHRPGTAILLEPCFGSRGDAALPLFLEKLDLAIANHTIKKASAFTCDRKPEIQAGLLTAGFTLLAELPMSSLDLERFDPEGFQTADIEVKTAFELDAAGIDWMPELYGMMPEVRADIPNEIPGERETYEEFVRIMNTRGEWERRFIYLAYVDSHLAGYCRIENVPGQIEAWHTGITGVARAHRRKGVAMAMKIAGLKAAKEHGGKVIITENDSENPMLELNLQLGFQPQFKWLRYVRG